jgi:hypothetical protein
MFNPQAAAGATNRKSSSGFPGGYGGHAASDSAGAENIGG